MFRAAVEASYEQGDEVDGLPQVSRSLESHMLWPPWREGGVRVRDERRSNFFCPNFSVHIHKGIFVFCLFFVHKINISGCRLGVILLSFNS